MNPDIHDLPETGPDKGDNVTRPPQIPDVNREQFNFKKDSKYQNLDENQRANTSADPNPEIVLNEAESSLNVIQGYSKEEIGQFQELDADISPIKTWKEQSNKHAMGNEILTCSPTTPHLWL